MSNQPPKPPGGDDSKKGGLVSHQVGSVADALPTADEGDALFDELFGNVFDDDEDLGDATAIAEAGIAEPLDDDLPVPPLDLDEPLAERDETAMGLGPPPVKSSEEDEPITNRPPPIDDDLSEPIPYAEPYVVPDVEQDEGIVLADEVELIETAKGPPVAPDEGFSDEDATVMMDRPVMDFTEAVRPESQSPTSSTDRLAEEEASGRIEFAPELEVPAARDEIDTVDLSGDFPEVEGAPPVELTPAAPPGPPRPPRPPPPPPPRFPGPAIITELDEAELTPEAIRPEDYAPVGAVYGEVDVDEDEVALLEADEIDDLDFGGHEVIELDEAAMSGDHAVVALVQAGEREAWIERARWLYDEAPKEPQTRADALLVVSELFAMAGEDERAETVAREALGLAPSSPIAHRQLRGMLMARNRWLEVGDALEAEARVAPSSSAKLHSIYLASEVARLAQGDAEAAERRLDQAERADPDDIRPQLGRLMRQLAASDDVATTSFRGAAEPLAAASERLRGIRSDGAEGDLDGGAHAAVVAARNALRERNVEKAIVALSGLEDTEFGPGASWLIAVLAAPHATLRAQAVSALERVSEGSHGALATRAMATRALEAGEAGAALKVASIASEGVLSAGDRLTIVTLSSPANAAPPADLVQAARTASHSAELAPLALAASASFAAAIELEVGEPSVRRAVTLGRRLADSSQGRSTVELPAPAMPPPPPLRATPSDDDMAETPLLDDVGVESLEPVALEPEALKPEALEPESFDVSADELDQLGEDVPIGLGEELRASASELLEADPTHGVARAVLLEDAYANRQIARVAEALLESAELAGGLERERALASALLAELAGNRQQMLVELDRALSAAPDDEAALRMSIADADPETAAAKLLRFAETTTDPLRVCLALTEAGLRLMEVEGEEVQGEALLRRAAQAAPDIPIAPFIGMYVTQAMGDIEGEQFWLDLRRASVAEPTDAVADMVRQASRLGEAEAATRANLLEEAHRARPDDYALRELYEAAAGTSEDRASWLMERAAAGGRAAASLALEAALAQELDGDIEQAAACASRAAELGDVQMAPTFTRRYARLGQGVAAAVATLDAAREQAETPEERRDLFSAMARIETLGGDADKALTLARSALQEAPSDLLTIHDLVMLHVRRGLDEGLDDVALAAARALSGAESAAHAMLAARLRSAQGHWKETNEPATIVYDVDPNNTWALRQVGAHAQASGEHALVGAICMQLAESAASPLERATLLLRASEAQLAHGDDEEAGALLGAVIEEWPRHPVALRERAALLERAASPSDAAEAYEEVAMVTQVPSERAAQLYKAAVLWLSLADDVGQAEGRRLLEAVVEIDPAFEDSFDRLQAIYVAGGAKRELAELLAARIERVTDPDERVALEVMRGKMLVDAGSPAEARFALGAALEASPDNPEALSAYADVCAAEKDWEAVEQSLIRLGRLVAEPEKQVSIYLRLGELYDRHLPNPERADQAYQQVLKLQPDNLAARQKLVDISLKAGNIEQALAAQQDLLNEVKSPEEKCELTVKLAEIHETAGDLKQAEQTLVKARRAWPREASPMLALYKFYRRTGQDPAAEMLVDRAQAEVRRGLGAGRFEAPLFAMAVALAELRGQADAAEVARATLAAIQGETSFLEGAGPQAGQAELDEHIAPDIFTPAFRSLLRATGWIMDRAAPFELGSLRARELPPNHESVLERTQELAAAYGLPDVQVVATNALGQVCVPAQVDPPILCFGLPLVTAPNARVRDFLIHRALKIVQSHTAALSRTAPIDLWPLLAAYLKVHSPSFNPTGVDAGKVSQMFAKMKEVAPAHVDPQINLLASEVIGTIGNRASSLNTAASAWGDRAALLAMGDANLALEAIALAHGSSSGPPPTGAERVRWIGRQAEARDLIVFAVSEGYAEARVRLGLEVIESIDVMPDED